MSIFTRIFENIFNHYSSDTVTTSLIMSVLIVVAVLGAYEFFVYRFVSHRAFYNKSFNICVAVLPFFIAPIILCLQSNIVITLGTIGALAIIRFRTSIKDPVDMLYLLWSVHTGIMCGCQLYEVALIVSLAVTVVMFILNYVNFGRKPFCVIIHCNENSEQVVTEIMKSCTKRFRIKSRNYTSKGMDFAFECSIKDPKVLSDKLSEEYTVERFSIIEYDNEDIV